MHGLILKRRNAEILTVKPILFCEHAKNLGLLNRIIIPDHKIQFLIGQRHIPDAEGRVGSVDNGIFIHAIVPRHVETVCLLYHKKNDFIRAPYDPKNEKQLKNMTEKIRSGSAEVSEP